MSAPLVDRRHRVVRSLTFWLRPGFVLRDRPLPEDRRLRSRDRLASSALTALIPAVILIGALARPARTPRRGDRIIERYELSGAGARAVRDVFSPVAGSSAGGNAVGGVLMLLAVLSLTRAFQRLFEQTWELEPLSVRNTLNGLRWIVAFAAYAPASGVIHALLAQDGADVPRTSPSRH